MGLGCRSLGALRLEFKVLGWYKFIERRNPGRGKAVGLKASG